MTPRFIIKDANDAILNRLKLMGFTVQDDPLSKDVRVVGSDILSNTTSPKSKNPLIKVFDGKDSKAHPAIIELATLHQKWTVNVQKTVLNLGEKKLGTVTVTAIGIMIDNCIIPITVFRKIIKDLTSLKIPDIVSHVALIDEHKPFLVIGCDVYSVNDIHSIISAYDKLLEPAP